MTNFESNESVFNMAMAYLKRIDILLYQTQTMANAGDVDGWLNKLRAIERELCVKLKKEEEEELETMFTNINKELTPKNRITNKGKIMHNLHLVDKYMRKKLQQRGMLLPNRSDPRFAILER